jgi:hypothetical protein
MTQWHAKTEFVNCGPLTRPFRSARFEIRDAVEPQDPERAASSPPLPCTCLDIHRSGLHWVTACAVTTHSSSSSSRTTLPPGLHRIGVRCQ